MMNFTSLATAALHFHELKKDMDEIGPAIIARACQMVCDEAKRVLGTEGYNWPALSAETLKHKMMSGMLLETGELRDSIEWSSHGNEGHVGSNNDKAVIHELGTSRIPARTFLVGAAHAMEPQIHAMAVTAVKAVMGGGSLYGSEMHELIHALKHVAHDVKELAHQVLEGDDPQGILR
jgi:phage gpG-like protein